MVFAFQYRYLWQRSPGILSGRRSKSLPARGRTGHHASVDERAEESLIPFFNHSISIENHAFETIHNNPGLIRIQMDLRRFGSKLRYVSHAHCSRPRGL